MGDNKFPAGKVITKGDLLMEQKNNDEMYDEMLSMVALEKQYEELTLKDDFMFGKIMQDERNCIDMLERLTGNKIEGVKSVISQKAVRVTNDSKGVRYDIYVEDNKENIYDSEMQQEKEKNMPMRARFYQGLIDLNMLEIGKQYAELKNSYVIFICTFDLFDKGLYCYEFENICKDDESLKLQDGRKILIFNTKGSIVNVSRETQDFLEFIETNKTSDEYTERLNNDVKMARMNKEWRVEYMKTLLHDMDVMKKGSDKKLYAVVRNLLNKGMDISEICEVAECSEEYVEEVRKNLLVH